MRWCCLASGAGASCGLDGSGAGACCACGGCGWGLFGHFCSRLSFLFSFSLSLGGSPVWAEVLSRGAVGPKTTSQPTDPLVFRTKFHELLSDFPNYETIFTDGSKDGDTAGSACVSPSDTYKCRLPDGASIFSAEIKAIDLALDHIEQSRNSDFIIFSDSLSVLQSLHNRRIANPLLLDVLLKHNGLAERNSIVFVGFPVMLGLEATKKPTSLQNRP